MFSRSLSQTFRIIFILLPLFLFFNFVCNPSCFIYLAPFFPADISLSAKLWRRVLKKGPPVSKQGASKVQKQKQSHELVLCLPQALRMPLCKECKKFLILSSSSIITISHFQFTPLPPPPLNSPPLSQGWA